MHTQAVLEGWNQTIYTTEKVVALIERAEALHESQVPYDHPAMEPVMTEIAWAGICNEGNLLAQAYIEWPQTVTWDELVGRNPNLWPLFHRNLEWDAFSDFEEEGLFDHWDCEHCGADHSPALRCR